VEYADKAELVRARAGLMHDLRDAEAELQAADAAALPFEQAFSRAHARLREALGGEAALRRTRIGSGSGMRGPGWIRSSGN